MAYRDPPSDEEELARLSKQGTGCQECESRGTHGGHQICRRQVAGKYNREVFFNRNNPEDRPTWCPKGRTAKRGYATSESLPEVKEKGKESPGPQYQTAPASPMPTSPPRKISKQEEALALGKWLGDGSANKGKEKKTGNNSIPINPPPRKEPRLKRKPKDAPWGKTD